MYEYICTIKWIPCKERLPKEDEYNLVQTEYGDMTIAKYTHSDYWEEIHQLKPVADEIVAWMPLPEPYTEAKETEYIGHGTDAMKINPNLEREYSVRMTTRN